MGFLLVFDLTCESSFLNVRNWIGEIQANAYSENVDMILVGNKCDLDKNRIISKVRAQEFATQNHVDYIETSALLNINVAESVELLLDSVMDRLVQKSQLPMPNQFPRKASTGLLDQEDLARQNNRGSSKSYCCSY